MAGEDAKERGARWSEAEARSVLGELAKSGLSLSRFAARRGLGRERLYKWRRRLARTQTPMARPARFTEVQPLVAAAVAFALRWGDTRSSRKDAGAPSVSDCD